MAASLRLVWHDGVAAATDGEGTLVVQGPRTRVSLRQLSPTLRAALGRLDPPGEGPDELSELVQRDGNGDLARWYYCLERLTRQGLLCHAVHLERMRLATLVAVSPRFAAGSGPLVTSRSYVLSRFAYLRRHGEESVLESPLAHARVILNDCRTAALIAALAAPLTPRELAERVGALPAQAVASFLILMLRAGMLDEADSPDESPSLQTWEFHDLLFHARSRRGRFDAGYGGTCRLADQLPLPPALHPLVAGEAFALPRPDLERLEQDDPPLARVQALRRSVRTFDADHPLIDRQLGEFLFRVARVVGHREGEIATPHGPIRLQTAPRPYPAGGSLYELEVYAVIQHCAGLAPGLHYYDPAGHQLIRMCELTADVADLIRDAAHSAGIPESSVQVLLILTARFARVAWKYESIAYALTLKHVGVVYQTMYLAATAMGLGACALGGGDADLFARAAGTDYCTETSVGELLLGNPQPEPMDRDS